MADRAGRDPGDYQHRGTGHARRPCAWIIVAILVSAFFPALVNAVPVRLLHYSIVWAVIEGVDVVTHNVARLSMSLRTGGMRPLGLGGDVVDGNTAMWVVLSKKTSTRVPAGMTIDA
jgi:hypothetical protein